MKNHLIKLICLGTLAAATAIFFLPTTALAESKSDPKKMTKKHAKKECLKAGIKGKKETIACINEKLSQK